MAWVDFYFNEQLVGFFAYVVFYGRVKSIVVDLHIFQWMKLIGFWVGGWGGALFITCQTATSDQWVTRDQEKPSVSPSTFSLWSVTTPLPSFSLVCSLQLVFLCLNEVRAVDLCQCDSRATQAGVDTQTDVRLLIFNSSFKACENT